MHLPRNLTALMLIAALAVLITAPAAALDDEHWKMANQSIDKGIAYLVKQQSEDGSWMTEVGPAVTGLALNALLNQPEIGPDDPAAKKAIDYILSMAQEDGSIRNGPEGILPSYNTAICLSALAPVMNDPEVAQVIKKGQAFLRGSQWIIGMTDPKGNIIDEKHPYAGGFGYGKHGRPDISNTQMVLQAMHDTGVDCEDPVFQRALTFLNRLQAVESNDLFAEQMAELDGGFIYSPSVNKDAIGKPESKANQDQIDEAKAGRPVSGLRTYGSVTYAGFKSLIYANLDRDDQRVVAALDWISRNYTLEQNPGMPEEQKLQGLYYYYLSMGRAMNAYGRSSVKVIKTQVEAKLRVNPSMIDDQGALIFDNDKLKPLQQDLREAGIALADCELIKDEEVQSYALDIERSEQTTSRDWANDLIRTITSQQHAEGWWANTESRWLESQPILVTAYSIIALQNAID